MKASVTTGSLYQEPFGDQDQGASAQQVPGVYQPSAENDADAGQDIDENHGGINQTVIQVDGAARTTTISMHDSSAPTPEDMGIS